SLAAADDVDNGRPKRSANITNPPCDPFPNTCAPFVRPQLSGGGFPREATCSLYPSSPRYPRRRRPPTKPARAGGWRGSLARELIPPRALRDEARRRASADWLYPLSVTARAGSESEQPNTARRQ